MVVVGLNLCSLLRDSMVLNSLGEETVDSCSTDLDGAMPFAREDGGKRRSGKGYLQCWRRGCSVSGKCLGGKKGPNDVPWPFSLPAAGS